MMTQNWNTEFGQAVRPSPIVMAGELFVMGAGDSLARMDIETGRVIVRTRLDVKGVFAAYADEGHLILYAPAARGIHWVDGESLRISASYRPAAGETLWGRGCLFSRQRRMVTVRITMERDQRRYVVFALDLDKATPVWETEPLDFVESTVSFHAFDDEHVCLVATDGRFALVDVQGGTVSFRTPVAAVAETFADLMCIGDRLITHAARSGIFCMGAAGGAPAYTISGRFSPPTLWQSLLLLVDSMGQLHGHDVSDGTERWRLDCMIPAEQNSVQDRICVVGDRAYFGGNNRRLWHVDLQERRVVEAVEFRNMIGAAPVAFGGFLVAGDVSGDLRCYKI